MAITRPPSWEEIVGKTETKRTPPPSWDEITGKNPAPSGNADLYRSLVQDDEPVRPAPVPASPQDDGFKFSLNPVKQAGNVKHNLQTFGKLVQSNPAGRAYSEYAGGALTPTLRTGALASGLLTGGGTGVKDADKIIDTLAPDKGAAYNVGKVAGDIASYGATASVVSGIPAVSKIGGSGLLGRLGAGRLIDLPMDIVNAKAETDNAADFAKNLAKNQALGLAFDGGLEAVGAGIRAGLKKIGTPKPGSVKWYNAQMDAAAKNIVPDAPRQLPRADAPAIKPVEPATLKPLAQPTETPVLRSKGMGDMQAVAQTEVPVQARVGASADVPGAGYGKNTVGAAQRNPASYDALQNTYGTIKPGENPARVVDVPKSTTGQDKVRQFTRTAMEANATPDEMIPLFEQHVQEGLFSYKPRKDAQALDAAIKSITDKGYAGALGQWDDIAKGRKVASKDDMVLGQILYSLAAKNGDTETAMRLAAEIAAEGTRLGQGVQALRMLKKTTPEGKLYYVQKSAENMKQDLVKKYGKNAPEIKIEDSFVKDYLDAIKTGDQSSMDTALEAIEQHIADQIPSTLADKWNAWRYFSMLGNPRTHIRNVVGNALFYGTTKAKNGLAAAIEEGVDRTSRAMGKGGIARSKTFIKDAASVEFAKQDVAAMIDVLQGGGKYNPTDAIRDKRTMFNTKWLEKARKGAMGALEAEDMWFLRPHYIDSMSGYLSANKIDPAKITSAQLETARNYAIKEAQRATFRDASAVADGLNKFSKINMATHLFTEGLVPFKKTPINIAKRAVEYSPVGLAKGLKEALLDVPRGTKTAAEAIDTFASGLTGSGIMALGYWLASNGIITAGNDDDAKQQGFDNLTGGQNYALNIGDSSYTLDWAAPSAIPLFMGAEYFNRKGEDLSAQEFVNSLLRVGDPLVEMSMLQGLEGTIRTAAYSQSPLVDIPVNALASYVSQGVPTLFGQVARTIDDTRRMTYVEKGDIKPVSATLQKSQAKLPFASKGLTPRINAWGREVKQQGGNALSRAAQNMLSPGYYSKSKKTAVDNELERLYKQGVESNPYPQLAPRFFYVDGEIINLTSKEWEAYAKEKGQQSLQYVTDIMESPQYKIATDDEKAKIVSDVYEYSNAIAKSKVSDYELDGWMARAQKSPVGVSDYIIQRRAYSSIVKANQELESPTESASEIYRRALLQDNSLSPSEKASIDRDMTGAKNVPDYSSGDSFLLSQLTEKQQERYEKYNRGLLTAENYYEIVVAAGHGKTKDEKLAQIQSLGYSRQQSVQIYNRILSK